MLKVLDKQELLSSGEAGLAEGPQSPPVAPLVKGRAVPSAGWTPPSTRLPGPHGGPRRAGQENDAAGNLATAAAHRVT
jgi:hypothetical protein